MRSHVANVQVRLRVHEHDAEHAGELRHVVETRFLQAVLDALDEAVQRRFGAHALLRIQRLPIAWRMTSAELVDPMIHRRLGEELASAVLHEVAPDVATIPTRPSLGATFALFDGLAHVLAVALVERGEGRSAAFYHPARTVEELWTIAAEAGHEHIERLVEWLLVLDAPPAVWLAVPSPLASFTIETSQRPLQDHVLELLQRAAAETAVSASRSSTFEAPLQSTLLRAAASHADDLRRVSSTTETHTAVPSSTRPRDLASPSGDPLAVHAEAAAEDSPHVSTSVGGVVMLLHAVLELEIAEHLWCVGLHEGDAIAKALALLVPDDLASDPVFAVIAGRAEHAVTTAELPETWAASEVIDKSRDALGRWLARRGDVRDANALASEIDTVAATLRSNDLHGLLSAIISIATCTRLGIACEQGALSFLVQRTGRLLLEPEHIWLEMPLGSVDVDVRRAGLDRDPGWVPWLDRWLRIRYIAGAGDEL